MTTRNKTMGLVLAMSLLAVLALGVDGAAREIRIFPVPVPVAPCNAAAAVAFTACDLVRAAAGFAPTTGPDAGITPQPGDTLVLEPGVYFLIDEAAAGCAAPGFPANGCGSVVVPGNILVAAGAFSGFPAVMQGLEIRSRDGASVTVIDGQVGIGGINELDEDPCVLIAADNVRFGGDTDDMGLTVQNCNEAALGVGQSDDAGGVYTTAARIVAGGGQADEDIVIQRSFFQNSEKGIVVAFGPLPGVNNPRSIENYRIEYNEVRRNEQQGILFHDSVNDMGGASEDEGIFIIGNIVDSNGSNPAVGPANRSGIEFENLGDHEQVVIQKNYIVRNGDNGIFWDDQVRQIEHLSFEGNLVMFNGFFDNSAVAGLQPDTFGAGVVFANTGQIEDLYFIGNHDDEFEEGITGNAGSGVLFASLIAFGFGFVGPGAGVQDLDRVYFEDNVINENGDGVAGAIPATGMDAAGPGARNLPFDGVTVVNQGDVNDFYFKNNNVRLNAGSGFTMGIPGNALGGGGFRGFAHPGDFDDNIIEYNVFWNNGTSGNNVNAGAAGFFPHGDGFAVFSANDINGLVFRSNQSTENHNHGIFLGSVGNDVTGIRFYDNMLDKNGMGVFFNVAGAPTADGLEISTFGDINDIVWDGGSASNNGGNGINLDANNNTLASPTYGFVPGVPGPNPAFVAVNLADLDDVLVTNGVFNTNGSSAPIGAGNGIQGVGDKISQVDINNVEGHRNDDHGVLLTTVDDMDNVVVSDATFEGNDRNRDSVGSGLFFDSTDDMDRVSVANVTANGNHIGFRFDVKGENGRNLFVTNSTANSNDEEGALIDGSDDLSDVLVDGNTFHYNNIGLTLRSTDRGNNLEVSNNDIKGDNGDGIGVQLEAIGVSVTGNSIRNNSIGIDANRAKESGIHGNNIARNEDYGVDALGLKPGETIDASNNWWGEPSGPKADGNPNGLGDRLTDKVNYEPFLGEPAVATDVNFQIIDFSVPETGEVGTAVTITATVRNNGTEEGTQNLSLSIAGGDFVNNDTLSRTLNPATEVAVSFTVNFPRGGSYTISLSTQNDTAEATIDIGGPTGLTIEQVCDANDNNRIDDDEILTCIGFWVVGDEVPGTGQSISDSKILFLIELWVTNGDISTLPAQKR